MASETEMLSAIEALLKEFYAAASNNARKKEIELILSQFGQQFEAWKHCLFFLSNTRDEFVSMYSLNVLENVVYQQWTSVQPEDRLRIRQTVYQLLLIGDGSVISYIRNKMAKLIICIARQDWPHSYPDFYSNILALISCRDTIIPGLILLQTASEELTCPRHDLVASRKDELYRLMLEQVPSTLMLLNDVLRNNIGPKDHLLLSKGDRSAHADNVLDIQSLTIVQLVLNCICHMFSWIPILSSSEAPAALFDNIFQCAAFGCQLPNLCRNDDIAGVYSRLGESAMSCINELLSKNRIPTDCEQFLLTLFSQTYALLQCFTGSNEPAVRLDQLSGSYVDKFTEFLQLFVNLHLRRFESNIQFPMINFLSLFFKYTFKQSANEGFYNCLHIWAEFLDYIVYKMEERSCVKADILSKYVTSFYRNLSLKFADGIVLNIMKQIENKYEEALVALATELLRKIQFRYNQTQLEELDDDILDDDCKTEWQYFLSESLDMLAKIAQLYPNQVFQVLLTAFHENHKVYIELEQYVNGDSTNNTSTSGAVTNDITSDNMTTGQRRLRVTAENDCRRLHCTLRDLSSLLQALGALRDHFISSDAKFEATFHDGYLLVDRLLSTAVYSSRVRLYETSCAIEEVLKPDFTEVHAQSLAAVTAYIIWITQFYGQAHPESAKAATLAPKCEAMINSVLQATVPLLTSSQSVPEKVLLASAHLLLALLTGVRPAHLYNNAALQRLYADGIKAQNCPQEVELIIMRALSHYLMLPWAGGLRDSEQDWAERAARLTLLFQRNLHNYTMLSRHLAATASIDYTSVATSAALDQGKSCLHRALCIMTDIVDTLGVDGVSRSKQICYTALCDYIDIASQLLTVYLRHTDVIDQILGFFLATFRCLRVQMGLRVTEKLIQMLMGLFTRDQLIHSLQQETTAGHQLISKFLKILQVIIVEPNASFKAFLPSILDLCLNQVYPILAERTSPEVKPTLYELLFQFLHYNWRYFFRTSVVQSINKPALASTEVSEQDAEIRHQFVSIIQAFGQSFLQPDIELFRQNLQFLESLNDKHQLYQKEVMRTEGLLPQLLTVLLQVLIHRSHALLTDDIILAIYNMASINLSAFYSEFIVHFLRSINGIDDQHKELLRTVFNHEQDLPSFTCNVNRFVNDIRFYQMYRVKPATTA